MVKIYTQIILRNKRVTFPQSLFIIYNQFTAFGYIYILQMIGTWEMHTKFSRKTSRESVSSET